MSKIKNEGDYRGSILSSAAGLTKNDYPQAIVEVQAEEVYEKNETGGEWVPLPEPFETLVAYLVLIGKDGTMTKGAESVQSAMGWSGRTFAELNDKDFSDTKIQFRVEENEYPPGNFKMQIRWINSFDVDPNRSIKKLDKAVIKNLDAKHGAALRSFSKKAPKKTAASPATPPTPASGPPKKKALEYTADAVWKRFQTANDVISEEDLCTVWETVDNAFDKDSDDRTPGDWKKFEKDLIAANAD